MANFLVVFASLNQVALIKRDLYRSQVYVEMLRTPLSLSATGCSFALRCRNEDLLLMLMTCKGREIEPGGVFEETAETKKTVRRVFSMDELEQ